MEDLTDCLKKNKPNVSVNTIKTYLSLLRSFYYKHNEPQSVIDCKWFEHQDKIIELLKDKPPASRKTMYASLIAVSSKNDKYKKALVDDARTYQTFINTQTKTPTQEENWKSLDDVREVFEDMHESVKHLLVKKKPLTNQELIQLQDFVILSLTSGYYIPPRRSSDWIYFKLKDINKETDNFIDRDFFVFNKYKTAKYYAQQRVEIPKDLKLIINRWLKLNPYDTLLFDNTGKPLSAPRLTMKLNSIFNGKISTSMLRHIYLSDKLKDVPAINDLQKQASAMGHSVSQAMEYAKK